MKKSLVLTKNLVDNAYININYYTLITYILVIIILPLPFGMHAIDN